MVVALSTGSAAAASLPSPYAEGRAYDTETGLLLYREQHLCDNGLSRCTVLYRDASGDLFARKELDYSDNKISPALVMKNYRSNTEVRISTDGAEGIVVDAGFDNFIRDHWDILENGEMVPFSFQVAGYDSPLDMVVGVSDEYTCEAVELCLMVNARSWLIRALTDPIQLIYSRADRKLMRYRGISNLRGERGESMTVDIVYTYGEAPFAQLPPDKTPLRF